MKYNQYTDGKSIYYVSAIYGSNIFAICKKKIGDRKIGVHRYKGRSNNPTDTPEIAQERLEELAVKKGWQLYFDEV